MPSNDVERPNLIQEWPEVRGLRVTVLESIVEPRTVTVAMETDSGWLDVSRVDSIQPGARARAISLGDLVYDVLEAAEMTWFPAEALPLSEQGGAA